MYNMFCSYFDTNLAPIPWIIPVSWAITLEHMLNFVVGNFFIDTSMEEKSKFVPSYIFLLFIQISTFPTLLLRIKLLV